MGEKGGGVTPGRSRNFFVTLLSIVTCCVCLNGGGGRKHYSLHSENPYSVNRVRTPLYPYSVNSHFSQGHLHVRLLGAYILS